MLIHQCDRHGCKENAVYRIIPAGETPIETCYAHLDWPVRNGADAMGVIEFRIERISNGA